MKDCAVYLDIAKVLKNRRHDLYALVVATLLAQATEATCARVPHSKCNQEWNGCSRFKHNFTGYLLVWTLPVLIVLPFKLFASFCVSLLSVK